MKHGTLTAVYMYMIILGLQLELELELELDLELELELELEPCWHISGHIHVRNTPLMCWQYPPNVLAIPP